MTACLGGEVEGPGGDPVLEGAALLGAVDGLGQVGPVVLGRGQDVPATQVANSCI